MSQAVTLSHQEIWHQKAVLRAIYEDYYDTILSYTRPGNLLEVGGGSANFKGYLQQTAFKKKQHISFDITQVPGIDLIADAHNLPFQEGSFDNIILIDTLHHLERPIKFLREAQRILKNKGRLILLEPGMTPLSILFFKLFHDEPVLLKEDPLKEGPLTPGRDPFDSNQAIPDLIFKKDPQRFHTLFPAFKIYKTRRLSVFAYPLSGGFKKWSLLPKKWVNFALKLDKKMEWMAPLMSFRLLVVVEKDVNG
jgi:SAM-dependent methyltransferase